MSAVVPALSPFELKLEAEMLRRDLEYYSREAWPHCEAEDWIDNWHHGYLAEIGTAVFRRQVKRGVIAMPPRYGKTFFFDKSLPTWIWANDGGRGKFVFGTHSEPLAIKVSQQRRTLLESEWYRSRFDNVQLVPGQIENWYYQSRAHGSMQAVGVGTRLTGWGGDYLILDDPIAANDRHSKAINRKTRDFIEHTWSSRLNDKVNGVMLCVMQRLGMNDPAAMLIEEGWELFELQGMAERKTIVVFPLKHPPDKRDPAHTYNKRGQRVVVREEGEALWEAREPAKLLRQTQEKKPEYFSTQYQQRPKVAGGGVIKDDDIRHWDKLPDRFDQMIQVWDCTFTDTTRADFVVGQVWGRLGPNKFLVDQQRRKAGLVQTVKLVRDFRAKHAGARATYIERKANGFGVIEELKRKIPNIIPYDPDRDKLSRLVAVEEEFTGHNVFFPPQGGAFPWVKAMVARLTAFMGDGTVDYDDEIDCITCALKHLRYAIVAGHGFPEGVGRSEFTIPDRDLVIEFDRRLPFDEGESRHVEHNPFA